MSFENLNPNDRVMLEAMAKERGITPEALYAEMGIVPKPIPVQAPREDIVVELGPAPAEESHPLPDIVPVPPIADAPLPPEYKEEDVAETTTTNDICMHCGWNNNNPVISVTDNDKLIFLQSFLGQKLFSKHYSIMDGKISFMFRSLTVKEIDAIYAEAFKFREQVGIRTSEDFYEFINRMRLNLQLIRFTSPNGLCALPEGLDKTTNRQAASYWQEYLEKESYTQEGQSLLQQINQYLLDKVLISENIQRIAYSLCSDFNKLTVRLEANVLNENFWKTTGLPL